MSVGVIKGDGRSPQHSGQLQLESKATSRRTTYERSGTWLGCVEGGGLPQQDQQLINVWVRLGSHNERSATCARPKNIQELAQARSLLAVVHGNQVDASDLASVLHETHKVITSDPGSKGGNDRRPELWAFRKERVRNEEGLRRQSSFLLRCIRQTV